MMNATPQSSRNPGDPGPATWSLRGDVALPLRVRLEK